MYWMWYIYWYKKRKIDKKKAQNVQLKKSDLKFRYFMNFKKNVVGREK